jgi:hypothetical protein
VIIAAALDGRWATSFVQAVQGGGGEIVATGYIPRDAPLEALEFRDQ